MSPIEGMKLPRKMIEKERITIAEAKEMLGKLEKEDVGEFQRRTLDYTVKFSKISADKAEKLRKELIKKFHLDEGSSIQVVNCLPKTVEELRTVLAVKGKVMVTGQLEEILKEVNQYRGK